MHARNVRTCTHVTCTEGSTELQRLQRCMHAPISSRLIGYEECVRLHLCALCVYPCGKYWKFMHVFCHRGMEVHFQAQIRRWQTADRLSNACKSLSTTGENGTQIFERGITRSTCQISRLCALSVAVSASNGAAFAMAPTAERTVPERFCTCISRLSRRIDKASVSMWPL
jgi:hypothetical protein